MVSAEQLARREQGTISAALWNLAIVRLIVYFCLKRGPGCWEESEGPRSQSRADICTMLVMLHVNIFVSFPKTEILMGCFNPVFTPARPPPFSPFQLPPPSSSSLPRTALIPPSLSFGSRKPGEVRTAKFLFKLTSHEKLTVAFNPLCRGNGKRENNFPGV